jgi:tetratricopeptide (TPR) repeat protein
MAVTTPARRSSVRQRDAWPSGPVVLALVLATAACASHPPGSRFIVRSGSGPIELLDEPLVPSLKAPSPQVIRQAEAAARASRVASPPLPTVESSVGELRAARAHVDERATPALHLRVAQAYWRVGVLDRALDHFDAALKGDSKLAAAYDGRARVWRDWHLPAPGIADAARAVYHAPRSAAARNTLGTLLLEVGDCAGARDAFRRAHVLDRTAVYAEKNLASVDRAMAAGTPPCGPPPGR